MFGMLGVEEDKGLDVGCKAELWITNFCVYIYKMLYLHKISINIFW